MISAEMHEEFHVPYLNQLSEVFGGIYHHTCGKWTHQFGSLEKITRLRGLEFGAPEDRPGDRPELGTDQQAAQRRHLGQSLVGHRYPLDLNSASRPTAAPTDRSISATAGHRQT